MAEAARMMLLFVSVANPLWRFLLRGEVTENRIAIYAGIARATITNWKKTEVIGRDADSIFNKIKENIRKSAGGNTSPAGYAALGNEQMEFALNKMTDFQEMYHIDPKPHIYEAAALLEISIIDCQRIIDDSQYSQRPIFPQMYFLREEECNRRFRLYGGVYYLWVKRHRQSTSFWFRCTLQVRYALRIRGGYVIRCKINFPRLKPLGPFRFWDYDGFLSIQQNSLFWMMERRPDIDPSDYFNCITTLGVNHPAYEKGGELLTMSGLYITTDQDQGRTITNGEVIMQKLDVDLNDYDRIAKIMRDDGVVIEGVNECDNLNSFLDGFHARHKG
jgi:hypothetical protein